MVLSNEQRLQIIGMVKAGLTCNDIASKFGCHKSTVTRLDQKYHQHNTTLNLDRGKSKKKFSARIIRRVNRVYTRDGEGRRKSDREVALEIGTSSSMSISRSSISNIRRELGLNVRRETKKPLLSTIQKSTRLQFALEHENRSIDEWSRVLFTDESRFRRYPDGAVNVKRRPQEILHPDCIKKTVKFGGGGFMVWGGISGHGPTNLVVCPERLNSEGYIQILEEFVHPWLVLAAGEGFEMIFMQDNAPCHTAARTTSWMNEFGFTVMPWPANSPDLNPIENVWSQMSREANKISPPIHFNQIEKIWAEKAAVSNIKNLINSMPERIQAVIKAKGGPIEF